MLEKRYSAREVCELLSISRRTLGRMMRDQEIEFVVFRSRVYFTETEVAKFTGTNIPPRANKVVLYGRVSSNSQKKDLAVQCALLEQFASANGYIVDELISDVGSGINFKRAGFLRLIKRVLAKEVSTIVITYEDRLVRFAFDFLKELCAWHDCQIIVINNKSTSPEAELVEDLMTVIHVFSSRLYGLRRNKRTLDAICRESEDPTSEGAGTELHSSGQ